jgi:hypothetical protein
MSINNPYFAYWILLKKKQQKQLHLPHFLPFMIYLKFDTNGKIPTRQKRRFKFSILEFILYNSYVSIIQTCSLYSDFLQLRRTSSLTINYQVNDLFFYLKNCKICI